MYDIFIKFVEHMNLNREQGKGAGYERWAKVYNIKQVTKVLLFLQEHDCRDYETLAKRAEETSTRFSELSK